MKSSRRLQLTGPSPRTDRQSRPGSDRRALQAVAGTGENIRRCQRSSYTLKHRREDNATMSQRSLQKGSYFDGTGCLKGHGGRGLMMSPICTTVTVKCHFSYIVFTCVLKRNAKRERAAQQCKNKNSNGQQSRGRVLIGCSFIEFVCEGQQ